MKLILIFLFITTSLYAKKSDIKKFDLEAKKIDIRVKKIESFIKKNEKLKTTYEFLDKYNHNRIILKNDILFLKISYQNDDKSITNRIYYDIDYGEIKTVSYDEKGMLWLTYYYKNHEILSIMFLENKEYCKSYFFKGKKIKEITYYAKEEKVVYPELDKKSKKLLKFKDIKTDMTKYLQNYEKRNKNNIYIEYSEDKKKIYKVKYKDKDNFKVDIISKYPVSYIFENRKFKKKIYYMDGINKPKTSETIYGNNGEIIRYAYNDTFVSKLVYKNKVLVYLKYSGHNGTEEFYENGQKVRDIFYEDDKVYMESWYKNGVIIRQKSYYKGRLKSEINYENNEYIEIEYDENGDIENKRFSKQFEGLYKLFYKKITYYKNGKIKKIFIPKVYPKTIEAYKYTIKKIKKLKYNSSSIFSYIGARNGLYTEYYKNGNKKHFYEKAYYKILGKEIFYLKTGNISYQINHLPNGEKKSLKLFDDKQNIQFLGYYQKDKLYSPKTHKVYTGVLYFYIGNNLVEFQKTYKEGILISYIEYRDDKSKFKEVFYKSGKKIKEFYYRKNNNLWSKEIIKKNDYLYEEYYKNKKLKNRRTLKTEEKYDENGFIIYKYRSVGDNYIITNYYLNTNIKLSSRTYKGDKSSFSYYLRKHYNTGRLLKYIGYDESGNVAYQTIYDKK